MASSPAYYCLLLSKQNKNMTSKENNLVEITRSFSYKLNLGNYQTADFFCSEKVECLEKDAEKKSEALYLFCKNEVIKSVEHYRKETSKREISRAKREQLQELGEKWQNDYNQAYKEGDLRQEVLEANNP